MQVQAANVFLPNEHAGNGVMVALAPPRRVTDAIKQEGGEPEHDLHLTLAYLGKTHDYHPDQLRDLPGHVADWAAQHDAPNLKIHGAGTFTAPEEGKPHVLHALVNASGLHRMQADLVDHLKAHGYNPSEEHGYIPHITLGYTKHHVRFLPKLPRQEWTADHVYTAVGGNREGHPFRNGAEA